MLRSCYRRRRSLLVLVVQVDQLASVVERPAHHLVAQPCDYATRDQGHTMDGTCGGLLCFLRHRRGILVQADVPPFKLADHSARCVVGELAGKLKDGEEESEAWGNESSRAEYEEEDGTSK